MNEQDQAIKSVSRAGMLWGIITMFFGLLAIGSPLYSGLAVTVTVAIILLGAGLSMTIYAFSADSLGKGILKLLFGGLTIIIGLVMLSQPGVALAKLTLFLGIYFIIDGLMVIGTGINLRPQRGSGMLVFNGAVTLLLAWLILNNWPLSGAWAIGVLVGIRLVFAGMTMLALGAAGSKAASAEA